MKPISNNRVLGPSPDRSLWQSVLLLAVEEALYGVNSNGFRTDIQRSYHISDTRKYLTTPSSDLATVCANAGFEMDAVIEKMTKLISQAPSPDVLAQSKRAAVAEKREEKRLQKALQKAAYKRSHTTQCEGQIAAQ